MEVAYRLLTTAAVATILISTTIAQPAPRSHLLKEDAALNLLQRTLKRDGIYDKRISLE